MTYRCTALARQGVGSIGNAKPRIDQDRAHVGSIEVENFDLVRHPSRRDVGGLFVGGENEPMEVDTNRSVACVLSKRVGPGVEPIKMLWWLYLTSKATV